MFDELVAFFTCFGLISIWLCYFSSCYYIYEHIYRHEDVDSSIEDADDDNDQAFELECIGNPNVEVKIDCIILTLKR